MKYLVEFLQFVLTAILFLGAWFGLLIALQ